MEGEEQGNAIKGAARRGGPSVADVMERAFAAQSSRPKRPFTMWIDATRGFVVWPTVAGTEVGEFHRSSRAEAWVLHQVLFRPDRPGHAAGTAAEAVAEVGPGMLAASEAKAREYLRLGAERRQHIARLLASWSDPSARKGMPEFAALAWEYANEVREGNTKATATVAAKIGASPAVAAQRIKEARKRGLLTAGERGRASGTLTKLGMLYTRPSFQGFAGLRVDGQTIADLAAQFRLSEGEVGAALAAEGFPDLAVEPSESSALPDSAIRRER